MTREVFTPSPVYTISGTGPYTVTHPYQAVSEIKCTIFQGTSIVDLAPADFSISPAASDTDGDITLTAAAASLYAGAALLIRRTTVADQGWAGKTAREKGLEVQLDAQTQRLQEIDESLARAIKIPTGTVGDLPLDLAGTWLGFDASGNIFAGAGVAGVPVSAFMATLLDDPDAATARATLGIAGFDGGTVSGNFTVENAAPVVALSDTSDGKRSRLVQNGSKLFVASDSGVAFTDYAGVGDAPARPTVRLGGADRKIITEYDVADTGNFGAVRYVNGTELNVLKTPGLVSGTPITHVVGGDDIVDIVRANAGWQEIERRTLVGGEVAVDFLNLGDFRNLRLLFIDVSFSGNSYGVLRLSSDNGATWINAGYTSKAANDASGGTNIDFFRLTDDAQWDYRYGGIVDLFEFNQPGQTLESGLVNAIQKSQGLSAAGAHNALRFYPTSNHMNAGGILILQGSK